MIYALQLSKPDGESYLVRYDSEADGGRPDAYCGPLGQEDQAALLADITTATDFEFEGFEDNDEYERFEIAVVGSPARAWFDTETLEQWREGE